VVKPVSPTTCRLAASGHVGFGLGLVALVVQRKQLDRAATDAAGAVDRAQRGLEAVTHGIAEAGLRARERSGLAHEDGRCGPGDGQGGETGESGQPGGLPEEVAT
jgi:hypothetical protein